VSTRTEARDRFLSDWEAFEHQRGAQEPAFLGQLRRGARDQFAELGLPSSRQEEWRYTNVRPLAETTFEQPSGTPEITRERVEEISFPVFACSLFVFVNGRYAPELSTPQALAGGLPVESLAQLAVESPDRLEQLLAEAASLKGHPFAALNTAFLEDGALVTLPRDTDVGHAIHLVFVSSGCVPTISQPRVVVRAEQGSRGHVIQDHVSLAHPGEGAIHFSNTVTDVVVEANAELDLVLVQREGEGTHVVSNTNVRQERDSRFACHTMTLGGNLVRNDLEVLLAAEGADCTLNGLFLGRHSQLVDNHTLVDHAMPNCSSRELYKGILADDARGVFRGRVIVRPDAQKTNASQSNPNILLGDGAEINTKPQLEIHADDVKCSHGSAIGRIDEEALFYLRTRGIGAGAARALLTRGFAHEVIAALPHHALTDALGAMLDERLRGAGT